MHINDLAQAIKASNTSSATVDIRPFAFAQGYIRKTTIDWSNRVSVSFQPAGPESGGAVFHGSYISLDAAVRDLEAYLGANINEWPRKLYAAPPYSMLEESEKDKSDLLLAEAIRADSIQLPSPVFESHTTEWKYYPEFFAEHKTFFDAVLEKATSYSEMQEYARALSKKGRSRSEIMEIFSAAYSYCLRRNRPEDIIADVMDGISNSFGKGNPHNLDLP